MEFIRSVLSCFNLLAFNYCIILDKYQITSGTCLRRNKFFGVGKLLPLCLCVHHLGVITTIFAIYNY